MTNFKKICFALILSFSISSVALAKDVIVGGSCIGVSLSSSGALITDISSFENTEGENVSPGKASGIKKGDIIIEFNGEKVKSASDLDSLMADLKTRTVTLKICRDNSFFYSTLIPEKEVSSGKLKLGLWIKDEACGIGTLTYFDPSNNSFAALGHGIVDPDINDMFNVRGGTISKASVVSVDKGEKGEPGELNGLFQEGTIGSIIRNNQMGLFGKINEDSFLSERPIFPIASKEQVHTGSAFIYSNISGTKIEKFQVEILKILNKKDKGTKNMIIKITDPALIEKTGGIVQGMSGSPIVQDGKLIGAVTHVFVNDPTRGYGIFIENMQKETENII